MRHDVPSFEIYFNNSGGYTHVCQILAGFKMLEDQGVLKIKKVIPCTEFRSRGEYEHNGIVEAIFDDRILAYDMSDGYQSIHRKDVFDRQLDRIDYYFKRSFDPSFHAQMKNRDKVKPLGLNYFCTCKGNPYDRFYWNKKAGISELRRLVTHVHVGNRDKFFYTQFESDRKSFDKYRLLFLTRIWDSSPICAENIKETYPYFSDQQAVAEAARWKDSLDRATVSRIQYVKALREHFGDSVIAAIQKDAFSEKICPELIVDPEISERSNYLKTVKQNFICITSEGLHRSIGWKFAEYVAAGKAIVTEPLFYEVPYDFCADQNYLTYSDTDSLIRKCEQLILHPSEVHQMEEANRQYYIQHLRPDRLIFDTLNTANPERFF